MLIGASKLVSKAEFSKGDCWFLCALASIAEYENLGLVRNLFVKKQSDAANLYGVYELRFCKNGLWVQTVIDDYFPCDSDSAGGPKYSQTHDSELWVLLVEKAYAKLHGSYAAIESGFPFEAMMDLTGAPYKNFQFNDSNVQSKIQDGSLWDELCEFDKRDYIMACCTPGEDEYTKKGTKPLGSLVPGHAYRYLSCYFHDAAVTMNICMNCSSLLSCVTTEIERHKLCKVRNPWGNTEWDGDWSDNSALWTPEIRSELRYEKADDGIFWISFADLVQYFDSINVCLIRQESDPWVEFRFPFDFVFSQQSCGVIDSAIYELTLESVERELFIAIHQKDHRIVGAPSYIDCGITLLKATDVDGEFEYIASTQICADRQNQLEVPSLNPGRYYLIPASCGWTIEREKINGVGSRADESSAPDADSTENSGVTKLCCLARWF